MSESSCVSYVGDPDFHDGSILAIERQDGLVRVRVRGASGRVFVVTFGDVLAVRANCAEGMMLYALTELRAEPPLRRFVFANWNDDSKACLEVEAASISVHSE
jgi:hypothetical protein